MDRETVARLAKEAGFGLGSTMNWIIHLDRFAATVAAAVKEEDARICEEWGHECHGEGRDDSEAFDCADRIRASIKEVK